MTGGVDEEGLRDAALEWHTGRAPETTLREYIHAHYYDLEEDEVDWGYVRWVLDVESARLDEPFE